MNTLLFRSSSFHRLNADKPLSPMQGRFWVSINRVNNSLFPNHIYGNLRIVPYKYELSEDDWEKSSIKLSPPRRLSELFFLKLPWDKIVAELGDIHVVDVGCGRGHMAMMLQDFSGQRIKSYTGIDVNAHPQWQELEKLYSWVHFHRGDSADVRKHIPEGTNLTVSLSALEHFENDLVFFRQIRDFVDAQKKPVLQLHLFPSPACLDLFGFHGVRQYTPRSVSMIAKLFHKTSYSLLFPLGGEICNSVHMEYITAPLAEIGVDLRYTKTLEYDRKVKSAIMQDMANNSRTPSFYALAIHSSYNSPIWD